MRHPDSATPAISLAAAMQSVLIREVGKERIDTPREAGELCQATANRVAISKNIQDQTNSFLTFDEDNNYQEEYDNENDIVTPQQKRKFLSVESAYAAGNSPERGSTRDDTDVCSDGCVYEGCTKLSTPIVIPLLINKEASEYDLPFSGTVQDNATVEEPPEETFAFWQTKLHIALDQKGAINYDTGSTDDSSLNSNDVTSVASLPPDEASNCKAKMTCARISPIDTTDVLNTQSECQLRYPGTPHIQSIRNVESREANLSERHSLSSIEVNFDPENTLIIFDWDDTILPSSWISVRNAEKAASRQSSPLSTPDAYTNSLINSIDSFGNADERDMGLNSDLQGVLDELSEKVCVTLQLACGLGKVVIVTNAERGWVELSGARFMPKVLNKLYELGISVVSARSLYESAFNPTPISWKLEAFYTLIQQTFGISAFCGEEIDECCYDDNWRESGNDDPELDDVSVSLYQTASSFQQPVADNLTPSGAAISHTTDSDNSTRSTEGCAPHQRHKEKLESSLKYVAVEKHSGILPVGTTPNNTGKSVYFDKENAQLFVQENAAEPDTDSETANRLSRATSNASFSADDRVNAGSRSPPYNILQFGDSESERLALFQVTKCLRDVRSKSFKFAEQPDPYILIREHELIQCSFTAMVQYDAWLDLKITVPPISD